MRTIPLTQGQVAIVDDADFEAVSAHKWYFDGRYACRRCPLGNKKYIKAYMHRFIAGVPGMDVDHKNLDRLDNRRSNLRASTYAQSQQNKGTPKNNKLGVKGVRMASANTFRAHIKTRHLGTFQTIEEASMAYRRAAEAEYGEFARAS